MREFRAKKSFTVPVISPVGDERLIPGPAGLNAGPRHRAQAAETGPVPDVHPGPGRATCQAVTEPAKAAKIAELRDRGCEINV